MKKLWWAVKLTLWSWRASSKEFYGYHLKAVLRITKEIIKKEHPDFGPNQILMHSVSEAMYRMMLLDYYEPEVYFVGSIKPPFVGAIVGGPRTGIPLTESQKDQLRSTLEDAMAGKEITI